MLQPPNGPRLISFLKAMEFSTLTRRVAEATGAMLADRARAGGGTARRRCTWPGYGRRHHRCRGWGGAAGAGSAPPRRRTGQAAHKRLRCLRRRARKLRWRRSSTFTPMSAFAIVPTLTDWLAEATSPASLPSRSETTSTDPMQAELTGLSLATRPGRAAYVPLSHKTGQGDLLGGGLAPDQISVRDALTLLKPLLQDKSSQDRAEREIRSCRDEPVRDRDRTV